MPHYGIADTFKKFKSLSKINELCVHYEIYENITSNL